MMSSTAPEKAQCVPSALAARTAKRRNHSAIERRSSAGAICRRLLAQHEVARAPTAVDEQQRSLIRRGLVGGQEVLHRADRLSIYFQDQITGLNAALRRV